MMFQVKENWDHHTNWSYTKFISVFLSSFMLSGRHSGLKNCFATFHFEIIFFNKLSGIKLIKLLRSECWKLKRQGHNFLRIANFVSSS